MKTPRPKLTVPSTMSPAAKDAFSWSLSVGRAAGGGAPPPKDATSAVTGRGVGADGREPPPACYNLPDRAFVLRRHRPTRDPLRRRKHVSRKPVNGGRTGAAGRSGPDL